MGLESATYLHQLDASNPAATDQVQQADDHLRLIKSALKNTFPNLEGPVTASEAELSLSLVPVGLISIWFGSHLEVPAGWAICNGQVVTKSDGSGPITTPDLRDRVVVGAGTLVSQGVTTGSQTATTSSSGTHSHTAQSPGSEHAHSVSVAGTALTEAQLPAHTHYVAVQGSSGSALNTSPNSPISHQGTYGNDPEYILAAGSGTPNAGVTSSVGSGQAHTHSASTSGTDGAHTHTTDTQGAHAHSVSTVQPSYGLHYIMKI